MSDNITITITNTITNTKYPTVWDKRLEQKAIDAENADFLERAAKLRQKNINNNKGIKSKLPTSTKDIRKVVRKFECPDEDGFMTVVSNVPTPPSKAPDVTMHYTLSAHTPVSASDAASYAPDKSVKVGKTVKTVDELQVIHELKEQALKYAQKEMLEKCVAACGGLEGLNKVNTSICYIIGYRKNNTMMLVEDEMVVDHDGEKFVFSQSRFLNNRGFQYRLRNHFATLVPEGWVSVFPGRTEGTYCITIQKRRD
jgi:hypothetical protein